MMKNFFSCNIHSLTLNAALIFGFVLFCVTVNKSYAQDIVTPDEFAFVEDTESGMDIVVLVEEGRDANAEGADYEISKGQNQSGIDPATIPSLFYTYWQHVAIVDSRRNIGMLPALSEMGDLEETLEDQDQKPRPPPEQREVRLGGIAFRSFDDWTVWLNEKRITPDAIPEEVLGINVYNDYIEVRWFDDYTNQIYPLRMRAHERFNLDTRIFLPGSG